MSERIEVAALQLPHSVIQRWRFSQAGCKITLSSGATLDENRNRPRPELLPRKGTCCTTESLDRGPLFSSVRARIGTAHGPMSGLHPYSDGALLVNPAPWRFAATTKTGNAHRQASGPRYGRLAVECDVKRAAGPLLGWPKDSLNTPEYRGSGASGLPMAAPISLARQCQCGGTIRQHELTGNREAWTCNDCGRYEIIYRAPPILDQSPIGEDA